MLVVFNIIFFTRFVTLTKNIWQEYTEFYMYMFDTIIVLTYICVVDHSIHIIWTSPFPILGVSGALFHFYFISDRYSC